MALEPQCSKFDGPLAESIRKYVSALKHIHDHFSSTVF